MDAAILHLSGGSALAMTMPENTPERRVGAAEFRRLLVSHRRMIRADRRDDRLKGLQDLDTGEVFLIDERRLHEALR